jgi:hypothetical protein
MIIDLILDRKDGIAYNSRKFYYEIMDYEHIFFSDEYKISKALDYGSETDVKSALCNYITENQYNEDICNYINSVNWL